MKSAVANAKKRKSARKGPTTEVPNNLDDVMEVVTAKQKKEEPKPVDQFMEIMKDPILIDKLAGRTPRDLPPEEQTNPEPEPVKRGPGRPKKNPDPKPKAPESVPISDPDLLARCKRKIKAYYDRFPKLVEILPPPNMASLTEEAAVDLCRALAKELCMSDPKPYIRSGVLWLSELLEGAAPNVAMLAGMDPNRFNLSVPHSFTEILDRGLTEDEQLSDAFDEICIDWLGEISSSPWTRLLLGLGNVAQKVARANSQMKVREQPKPDRQELLRQARERAQQNEEIPFSAD